MRSNIALFFAIRLHKSGLVPEGTLEAYLAEHESDGMLIGANYFSGWWDGPNNRWYFDGPHLLEQFPERTPLLGEVSNAEVLRGEFNVAANYGVDFFNFLWFGAGIQKPVLTDEDNFDPAYLAHTFALFREQAEQSSMRFSIEWTNHDPWSQVDLSIWRELVKQWIAIFSSPRYLTVENRIFFKIHSWHYWATGVPDQAERRQLIGYLRDAVRVELGKEILIGTGIRRLEPIVAGHPLVLDQTFDFTSIYLDVPNMVQSAPDCVGPGSFTYRELEMHQRVGRAHHAYDVIPFVPNIIVGWHPLWKFQHDLPRFAAATPEELTGALRTALRDITAMPGLRFPAGSETPARLLMIYAWNEFAEGGFLAPTRATGHRYLDALRAFRQGRPRYRYLDSSRAFRHGQSAG